HGDGRRWAGNLHPWKQGQDPPAGQQAVRSRARVLGKHYERDQRLSLLNCSALCPKEVYEVVQNNFKEELSLRPAEEREAIQRRLPSYKSVKALYYRKIRPGGVRGLRFSAAMQSEQGEGDSLL
ncbi:unnamed protein product, partial [Ixodes persulcatus]